MLATPPLVTDDEDDDDGVDGSGKDCVDENDGGDDDYNSDGQTNFGFRQNEISKSHLNKIPFKITKTFFMSYYNVNNNFNISNNCVYNKYNGNNNNNYCDNYTSNTHNYYYNNNYYFINTLNDSF